MRMVCDDHVGGLSLGDQRQDCLVDGAQPGLRDVQPFPGRCAELFIQALCGFGIILILCLDRAQVARPAAAVADIGSAVDTVTAFRFKARTDAVAFDT